MRRTWRREGGSAGWWIEGVEGRGVGDARLGLGVVCVQGQRSLPPHPCNSRRSPAKIAQVLSVEVFWSSQFVVAIGGDKSVKWTRNARLTW